MTIQLQIGQILLSISSKSKPDLTDDRLRFIPRDSLFAVLSADAVLKFLKSCSELPAGHLSDFADLVKRISPPSNGCRCQQPHCTGGRIIFAAFLSISKPELIHSVFQEPETAICDSSLPQQSRPTDGRNQLLEALRSILSIDELGRFLHFAWQMRSPIIENLLIQDPAVFEQKILGYPDNASLPWMSLDQKNSTDASEDGFVDIERTTVQKITIHPGHYEVSELDGDLALKIYDDHQEEEKYEREVKANLRVLEHNRIVPLLAAFKHRGKFHLVLPWAHGGNLADLFQNYSTPLATPVGEHAAADWYSEDWLLAECLGLAEGLDAVHQRSTSRQIHADIKPENILCFASKNKDDGPFTLKLADFGEAQQVDQPNGTISVKRVPHTKTYRPPEHDTDEALQLNYDVWCLGCVFLEFITWAIAGSEALDIFQEDRLEERDERKVTTAKGDVRSDTFFKKISASPRKRMLPQVKVSHKGKTIADKSLPRGDFRRRHRWWLEYAGTTRVKTLRKEAVNNHFTFLQEKCAGTRLHTFLEFIDSSMLLVNPMQRAQSAAVLTLLGSLQQRSS